MPCPAFACSSNGIHTIGFAFANLLLRLLLACAVYIALNSQPDEKKAEESLSVDQIFNILLAFRAFARVLNNPAMATFELLISFAALGTLNQTNI